MLAWAAFSNLGPPSARHKRRQTFRSGNSGSVTKLLTLRQIGRSIPVCVRSTSVRQRALCVFNALRQNDQAGVELTMLHVKPDLLRERFDMQRRAFASEPFPSLAVRKDRLKRLQALTKITNRRSARRSTPILAAVQRMKHVLLNFSWCARASTMRCRMSAPGCAPAVLAPACPFCRARTASCLSLSAWSASFHRGTIRSSSLLPRQRQRSRPATGC